MPLLFTRLPGFYESHLKRCYHNNLVQVTGSITQGDVNTAHQKDLKEVEQFRNDFTALMNRAIALESRSESETILQLKEDIDKLYEHCCSLTGDNSNYKKGLNRLMKVTMQAIREGAGNDPTAHEELSQEETARIQHHKLLEIPLIPHLLRPDSLIKPEQLAAIILGEDIQYAGQILSLFDHEFIVDLHRQAETLLAEHDRVIHGAPHAGRILTMLKKQSKTTTHH